MTMQKIMLSERLPNTFVRRVVIGSELLKSFHDFVSVIGERAGIVSDLSLPTERLFNDGMPRRCVHSCRLLGFPAYSLYSIKI